MPAHLKVSMYEVDPARGGGSAAVAVDDCLGGCSTAVSANLLGRALWRPPFDLVRDDGNRLDKWHCRYHQYWDALVLTRIFTA